MIYKEQDRIINEFKDSFRKLMRETDISAEDCYDKTLETYPNLSLAVKKMLYFSLVVR